VEPDERSTEAIELVRRARGADGRWPLQNPHPGRVHFELEREGEPSRWNTLRALRVLDWESSTGHGHRRRLPPVSAVEPPRPGKAAEPEGRYSAKT
jgi:hypothetical protein